MKIFRYLKIAALSLILGSAMTSCKEEITGQANAVLPENDEMVFAAISAEPQTMWIYADGEWVADPSADWFTMTPMFGDGHTEVTITVTDNVENGAMAAPREAMVQLRGGFSERSGSFAVKQKGDTYLGQPEVSVTEALALENESLAKLPESQVMALTTTGMVISDGASNMLVEGVGEGVKAGDRIYINGTMKVVEGEFPSFILDECNILSSGAPQYPVAKNISSEMDSYSAESMEFVTVAGSIVGLANGDILAGAAIRVPGSSARMMVAEVPAEMGMVDINYHFVEISGFYTGKIGNNLSFIPAAVKDNGLDESVVPVPSAPGTVLFEDNFDWMIPYINDAVAAGTAIGSSVEENNASGAAPNLYTTANLAALGQALVNMGYKDVNAAVTSIYPQNAYWKFGKTSAHTGLQIPSVDYYGELQLSFDWSPHMTGSGNIDKVNLVVSVTTGASTVIAAEFPYTAWEKGQLAWHPAKATINITPESIIQIRPDILEDHDGITQQRFYVDNIVVKVPAPEADPVYAEITVDEDLLTFEGEGGVKVLNVLSDNDYTIYTDVDWLSVDVESGLMNVASEVNVHCSPSELSVLRDGHVIIESGDTKRMVRVIQSAAGQVLDPLLSISNSSAKVGAAGGNVNVRVQANVDYTTSISAPWVKLEPATKGMVAQDDLVFVVDANETTEARTATVTFVSGTLKAVLEINQAAASKYEVIFSDDFSWLAPMIASFNADNADKPVSDYVGGSYASLDDRVTNLHQAPNMYTDAHFSDFPAALAAHGYTDLNPSAKVIYPQDAYLKFGKNNNSGGISATPFKSLAKTADVIFNFDWSVHMTGGFVVDAVTMKLYIEGEGTFANGTKESDDMTIGMTDKNDPFWKSEAVQIFGVNKDTKIQIISKQGHENLKTSGQHRWYIDNIVVEKVSETIFYDDFSWLKSMIEEYNGANATPIGNSVEGHTKEQFSDASSANAPNAYTAEPFKSKFPAALAAAGYTDLNAAGKVLYPQDAYIKLGKTSVHTSLQFAPFAGQSGDGVYGLSFDWCRHVQGTATIDPVTLTVVIEGAGEFENGTKYSDPLSTSQQYVVKDDAANEPGWAEMFWTNSSVKIIGADASTKINIVYTDCLDKSSGSYNWKVSGAHRYHIDNIKVVKF